MQKDSQVFSAFLHFCDLKGFLKAAYKMFMKLTPEILSSEKARQLLSSAIVLKQIKNIRLKFESIAIELWLSAFFWLAAYFSP